MQMKWFQPTHVWWLGPTLKTTCRGNSPNDINLLQARSKNAKIIINFYPSTRSFRSTLMHMPENALLNKKTRCTHSHATEGAPLVCDFMAINVNNLRKGVLLVAAWWIITNFPVTQLTDDCTTIGSIIRVQRVRKLACNYGSDKKCSCKISSLICVCWPFEENGTCACLIFHWILDRIQSRKCGILV